MFRYLACSLSSYAGHSKELEVHGTMGKRHPASQDRSLLCLIQSLVDHVVILETRDDFSIRGYLTGCDEGMNCTLERAVRVTPEGRKDELDKLHVRARVIRFVHMPREINSVVLVEKKRLEDFEAARQYQSKVVFGPIHVSKIVGSMEKNG